VSAAGEWRRINLGQVIQSVSDVFSEVHFSQADDVGSIPITRSNLVSLIAQVFACDPSSAASVE
jgi:hypothetical protein